MEFEDWFGIYSDELRKLGWDGPIDRGSAEEDHNNDLSPEEAARVTWDDLKPDQDE